MRKPIVLTSDHPKALETAGDVLRGGGLVAIPTDTVYGLAADAWNGAAISKLYKVKGRDRLKSIPVLVHGAASIAQVALEPSSRILAVADEFWPGPLTIVVERKPDLPSEISATTTVGVRAPDQEFALRLLAEYGPLATTSANRSGQPSTRNAAEVVSALDQRVDLVIDGGDAIEGVPSAVVDLTTDPPTLLRAGPVTLDSVFRVWENY